MILSLFILSTYFAVMWFIFSLMVLVLVFIMTGQTESRQEEKDSRGKTHSEWPCNRLAAHGSPAQPGELHQHHYFLIINGE